MVHISNLLFSMLVNMRLACKCRLQFQNFLLDKNHEHHKNADVYNKMIQGKYIKATLNGT